MSRLIDILFSVVIPYYGSVEDLRISLRSLLNQKCSNFEVIIVDDNELSHDSVIESVLTEFRSLEIVYIKNDCNKGAAASRNIGVLSSSVNTSFISLLDSGDEFYPNKICEEISLLRSDQSIDLIYSKQKYSYKNGFSVVHNKMPGRDIISEHILLSVCTSSAITVRKSLYLSIDGFCEKLRNSQDWDFIYRILIKGYNFKFIDLVLSQKNVDLLNSISSNVKKYDRTYVYVRIPALKKESYRYLFPRVLFNFYASRTFRSKSVSESYYDFLKVTKFACFDPKNYFIYLLKYLLFTKNKLINED